MSAARGWANPPPVVVVTGGQEYLRHREVRRAVKAASDAGRRIVWVRSGDSAGLREVLSGGFLFSEATLAVVESSAPPKRRGKAKVGQEGGEAEASAWSDADVEVVVEHGKASTAEVTLVVHHADDPPPSSLAGRAVAALSKGRHAHFPQPKPWKAREHATAFLVAEVRSRGKSIEEPLAEAVVRQAGPDLGLLAHEALKMSKLLDVDGRTEVRREDLVGLVASFGVDDWQLLKDALASRSAKSVVRVLNEIRSGPAGDSVVRACVVVSETATRWLHAAALFESGVGEEEAAKRVGVHPFPFGKDVAPAARRWGKAPLAALLSEVAAVEGGVRAGFASPWIALESALILACRVEG